MWVATYFAWTDCLPSTRVNCRLYWACRCIDWPAFAMVDPTSFAGLRGIEGRRVVERLYVDFVAEAML